MLYCKSNVHFRYNENSPEKINFLVSIIVSIFVETKRKDKGI